MKVKDFDLQRTCMTKIPNKILKYYKKNKYFLTIFSNTVK